MGKASHLSPVKQALLERRLKGTSAAHAQAPEIPRRPDRHAAPLSFIQRQMWVIDRMAPGNPAYNLPYGFRLRGRLDVAALEDAFNEVIKRHDSLRTTFAVQDGEPQQRIHSDLTVRIAVTALDHLGPEEREARLQALASEESVRPFDLSRLPLIRVSLFTLGDVDHVVIINLHHIVADGLSIGPLLNEVNAFYRAFTRGGGGGGGSKTGLPDLPVQYGDFALWQQQSLTGERAYADQIEFWRRQLGGTLPVLELPLDRPRPVYQSFRGANVFFRVPPAITRDVRSLAAREGCTPFMVLLAAFQVLLHRYSGADDIVIGTPIGTRPTRELEPVIGNFLNMVALRCDLSGDRTFVDVLRAGRETVLNAFSNGDLPFEAMVEHLNVVRDPGRNPIFQAGLQLLSDPIPRLGDLEVGSFDFDLKFAQFDLTLHLYEEAGEYRARFEYCTDLFDAATVERISHSFSQLLEAITRDPGQRIAVLPILAEAERRQLLETWSATAAAYPADRCLHQLIEEQAARTPDQAAVAFEDQRLTYRELDRRANQVAHHLRGLGAGPDTRVGLFVERSLDLVVGILGILKAGAAYVPVDTAFPPERIAFMLADAGATVVLTQGDLVASLPTGAVHPVRLDALDWSDADGATAPGVPVTAGHLAYVIYTSGSTGRPKGVGIEHRSIVNYTLGVSERLQLAGGMQHATVSTIAADLGNTVIFPALTTGGCLHVLSQERAESPAQLAEYFERERIDVLKIVPSHLAALQASNHPEQVMPRRRLILGGEASRLDWIASLGALAPTCEIHNHYGPTETTVGALTYRVAPPPPLADTPTRTLPLGRPLPGYRAYVLDPQGQPVPIGVQGELCIGGRGVARGYLSRPDLSAEKFVPDPFSPVSGDRVYRTGDRARFLADGNLEFRGRVDQQVKVHGYRIELGEIEAALREHPGVREAVVVARDDESGTKQLAGYIVPRRAPQPLWNGKALYVLPDGMPVAHLNKNETDYIYHEIFVLQAYVRHGITIQEGDVIVDAGANIGLFTVFASRLARDLRILAFEPNPAAFACLQANAAAWGAGARCLPLGLSRDTRSAELTFFEGFSLLSGFYADAATEREVVKTYALNQAAELADGGQVASKLDELLEDRFRARTVTAQLRALSAVLAEQGVERIDLLKVNVEKSELDVLQGISSTDWPKIRQVVVEVDQRIHVDPITTLLAQQGFDVLVEQDPLLRKTDLCYVYAMRPSATGSRLIRDQPPEAHVCTLPAVDRAILTPVTLRSHLRERLPAYMVPSAFVLLEALPLTSNGKVDRAVLPAPDAAVAPGRNGAVAPRTPTEEMVMGVFRDVLKRADFGVLDNFFDLGGHSLMAVRIMARLHAASGLDLPLRVLFERQTVAGLAEVIDGEGRSHERIRASEIPRKPDRDSAPLSFVQRQMWVIDQMTPGNPAYNMPIAFRLRGALDVTALEGSFNKVIERHEVLRTTFALQDGEPQQRIHPALTITIKVTALDELADVEREARAQALASEESARSFDLARLPLIRVSLFRLGDAEHVLLINLHHIVADGLSLGLLVSEVDTFYRALTGGGDPQPPELALQYADFAHWQRHTLADEAAYAKQIDFWRTRLAGTLPVLELPTDKPRPALQSFQGANVFFSLPPALAQALKALGAREGCTAFMTLLAAFEVLLQRHSGAEDIVIGTPLAARPSSELEPLIGNFLNMTPLRCDLSGDPTFIELLRRSRETTLEAFTNGDLPFEVMMKHLTIERDPSRNPIFQVLLQVLPTTVPSIGDLEVANYRFPLKVAQLDLSLHVYEEGGGYWGWFEYCSELLDAETVERLSSHFEQLLRAIVRDPRQTISEIPMLSAGERDQILHEWNDTAADLSADAPLHELFEAQAARTPEAVALEFEAQELTYAQLNGRANRLARVLRARGVGPEVLVGVLAERSFEMVVSLLAVLKAGGAYVPLDPSYPEERLRHMLEDARAPLVLAQPHLTSLLPADGGPVLLLDASWAADAGESGEHLDHVGTPENLAYVIFTSGSTGRPKGAMNTHRGICNRLLWMQAEYGLRGDDRVLQKTPFSFDVSVWEFFWPLLTGARLVIALPEGHKDSGYLVRLIRESRITTLHFVPSMMRVFLEEEGVEACASLRRVICSGEALPHEVQERFFSRLPGVELHNLYGPTEAAVDVTYWACQPGDERSTVPIGRPVANTQVYVLDRRLEPVPVGVPGELYIGGVQVGRGYVGRPDLTAERFVPDPFSKAPGARLYRTGDVVRYLSDGAVEYLGRLDYQVKIRGQRIELGEIEATLDKHPAVSQSVVVAHGQGGGGDQRLVAYVVPRQVTLSSGELREHLVRTLPQYMVPGVFVLLEALPLTPSGKVDRKHLPVPEDSAPQRVAHVAPRTPTEEMVMDAFRDVLGRADFGMFDNFFDLGGHSLMAARLMSKLRAASGLDLPLRNLFERPTGAALAEAIDALAWTATSGNASVGGGNRMEIEL